MAGAVLLLAGITLVFASSIVESRIEDTVVQAWDIWPSTLNPSPEPWNSTFWGRLMEEDWWFELDVSFSHPVRITVSAVQYGHDPYMATIFDVVGTRFTQQVSIDTTATYQVDIINEGPHTVDITGDIKAMREAPVDHTPYPYTVPGILISLVGIAVFLVGVFTGRKSARKSRRSK